MTHADTSTRHDRITPLCDSWDSPMDYFIFYEIGEPLPEGIDCPNCKIKARSTPPPPRDTEGEKQ